MPLCFWFGSVFLVNVPVCICAVVLGHFFIPSGGVRDERGLDPLGSLLSIVALFALMYGIITVPDQGWGASSVRLGFVIGALFLAAFAVWELRCPNPMFDVRFFKNPRFSAASATITHVSFALFGSTFLLTQYFQFVLGYSPLKAGMMTSPVAVGLMVASPNAPRLVHRFGTTRVVVAGLSTVACGLALYCSATIMSSVPLGMMVRLLFGLGMGMTSAPVTESIMGSLPHDRAGVGSAVNDTTRQTGGALGVAVLGSVFLARYHSTMGALAGVSPAVSRAAHDSVGSALDAAAKLPPAQAAIVAGAARHSFITAMRPAFAIACAVVVLSIFIAAKFLPARAAGEELSEEDAMLDEAAAEAVYA